MLYDVAPITRWPPRGTSSNSAAPAAMPDANATAPSGAPSSPPTVSSSAAQVALP